MQKSIQTYAILLCKDDVGSIVELTSSLVWAVILADFQRVISRYLQDISTYLSCTAQRVLRTILMQKYKLNYAYLPSKIVKVWIDQFCLHYDWWCRLQPTSSVSLVWSLMYMPIQERHGQFSACTWCCLRSNMVWTCHVWQVCVCG